MIRTVLTVAALFAFILGPVGPSAAAENDPVSPGLDAQMGNSGFSMQAQTLLDWNGGGPENVALGVTPVSQVEYKSTLGCGDTSDPAANLDPAACSLAQVYCAAVGEPDGVLYYTWFRRAGSGGAWQFGGQTCSREALPPGEVPPAVPSMAQIQQAFAQLPFGKPTVSIQP
ncbi:MAG: hypothetical protein KBB39_16620, partial [Phycicoccus sp.]|nr:hypothetical protein [Phycicoccus sp.]